eukprot:CAMPEP_0170205614 /NCGR_PEP_ID=MMETSP0116_2-20130129/2351_1 /TAXON_ID=400756 /ORGANISM="Durinskia baltica, Strain CSIRO CS-38" /LENGTH=307 /DNA_ID=CAMNT_0010456005 /DNA_START=47 /DNA_END=970 /DNA_ORIENTATION=-
MSLRLSLIIQVATALLSAEAFSVGPHSPVGTSLRTRTQPRQALIYGWDDDADDDMAPPVEMSFKYESELPQCTTEGVAVAESISYDPDRLGSLARLAVAFSPPERALKLDQIERVDILCVSQKHIDIQAIICEDGGCVSLAVPIQFPRACDRGAHLEGCVVGHLESLDASAAVATLNADSQGQLSWYSSENVAYPTWWVSPTSYDMIEECKNMCSILNEPEFQPEVLALVQEATLTTGIRIGTSTDAKVTAIGPAGFHFKVRTTALESPNVQLFDVFSPFGGTARTTSDDLRAAVLGIVATAGGEPA